MSPRLPLLFFLVMGAALPALAQPSCGETPKLPPEVKSLLGAWKQEGDKVNLVRFEPERLSHYLNGRLRFERVAYHVAEDGTLRVLRRVEGERKLLATIELKEKTFSLVTEKAKQTFLRLEKGPEELEVRPVPLGKAEPLAAEKINEIRRELGKRERRSIKLREELSDLKDVKARQAKIRQMMKTDADDSAYLKKIFREVGWIDSRRFGTTGLQSAYLICMHTHDFGLMLTGVQEVEREVKKGNFDAESWASLHDRFRVVTAQRERFGYTVWTNAKGELLLGPLEDRQQVDAFRKAYGLPTLAEYLQRYKDEGKTVRIVDED